MFMAPLLEYIFIIDRFSASAYSHFKLLKKSRIISDIFKIEKLPKITLTSSNTRNDTTCDKLFPVVGQVLPVRAVLQYKHKTIIASIKKIS